MSIGTLPINTAGKLTADVKKQLMLIIEQEFANKESLYHQAQEREKEKILTIYRKSIGYDDIKKEYDKKEMKIKVLNEERKKLTEKITDLGLTLDGDADSGTTYDPHSCRYIKNYKGKELAKKLEVLEANAPSQNLKSKLISRLMLSTSVGEANEIMREILGNGIIPKTDIKAISFQE